MSYMDHIRAVHKLKNVIDKAANNFEYRDFETVGYNLQEMSKLIKAILADIEGVESNTEEEVRPVFNPVDFD